MNTNVINNSASRGVIQVVSQDRIRRLEVCTQFTNLGYSVIPLADVVFSQTSEYPDADICVLLDQKTISEISFSVEQTSEQNLFPMLFYPSLAEKPQNEIVKPLRSHSRESLVPFAEIRPQDTLDSTRSLLDSAIKYARLSRKCSGLISELNTRSSRRLIGFSQGIQTLRDRIGEVVPLNIPVLVQGISGSELSLVAEMIHDSRFLNDQPLIKVNCSTLTTENFERELLGYFSHEESQYSNEPVWNPGRIEQSEGGTLIFDQVHLASLPVQALLLKILEHGEYISPEEKQQKVVNSHIISLSHVPLTELVSQNQFKRKLGGILAGSTISVPRLNDRKEDLALLTEHILNEVSKTEGTVSKMLTLDGLEALKKHDWIGDVQELRNLLRHVNLVDNGPRLDEASLMPWLGTETVTDADSLVGMTLREMEQKLIESTFARCGGNRENTAQMLDIGLRTLSGKLRSYGYPPRGGPDSKRKFTVRRAA
ncbi:MAG: sigma 54-interacting transcriptional regulator [Planctomycetes bacterium]|nr:sigma 54-interacting transcriptional regulator [Planctomycetota bacterium]MCH9727230.1 sigma 54-interacting transcriptional regulator [Planctomycetota bacterium]MCH9776725.1 sigma 54-interacting transcriptional regulator [Planctomycetota bacterium]